MARDLVALVSADDVVGAIRVHADRANDMLRRNGCEPEETAEILEHFALSLIENVDRRPAEVFDLAGWWFGQCLSVLDVEPFSAAASEPTTRARRRKAIAEAPPRPMLAGTDIEATVRGCIASLSRQARLPLVLRDSYDLPIPAVAVAIGRSEGATAELIANARLALSAEYDAATGQQTATRNHVGRQPVDLVGLSAVADGSAPSSLSLSLRRHVSACPSCEDTLERLGKARRLALGLPVLAMPDLDREDLLDHVRQQADATLPSHDEVIAVAAADSAARSVPTLVIVGTVIVAALLGVGIGVLSKHNASASATGFAVPTNAPLPPPATYRAPPVTSPPTTTTSGTPTKSPLPPLVINTSRPAPTTSLPTAPTSGITTSAGTTTPPTVEPTLSLNPTSGAEGTTIVLAGQGFTPDSTITVSYDGVVSATFTSDDTGEFTGTIQANQALPGDYTVEATDDILPPADAIFDQQL